MKSVVCHPTHALKSDIRVPHQPRDFLQFSDKANVQAMLLMLEQEPSLQEDVSNHHHLGKLIPLSQALQGHGGTASPNHSQPAKGKSAAAQLK